MPPLLLTLRRWPLGAAVLVTLLTPGAAVAEERVGGILPERIGSWVRVAGAGPPALGADASLLREYGSQRAEEAIYRRGGQEMRVSLQVMADRSGAFGAFTLLGTGGRRVRLGEAGAALLGRIVFYQGNFFVSASGGMQARDLEPLAHKLRREAGPQAGLPALVDYLPAAGRVGGSERYFLGPRALATALPLAKGDWAGFAYGAEAVTARYRTASGEVALLLLSYPTPQIAAERLRAFERAFHLNGGGNPAGPPLFARRAGSLIVAVAGGGSEPDGVALMERVRVERALSWSQQSPEEEDRAWARTMLGMFLSTGVIVALALAAGTLFGIARLAARHWYPGQVFDRPEDTEVIRLGLEHPRSAPQHDTPKSN